MSSRLHFPVATACAALATLLLSSPIFADESFPAVKARAEAGDVAAMLDVAHHYDWGTLDDVAQDLAAARLWYRKAADKGDDSAALELGKMAYDGRGTKVDPVEAARWFRKAAEHGNDAAQHLLAGLYEQGEGVAKDEGQARVWYREAAMQENTDAQFALGMLFAEGRGGPKDTAEAARWWLRAAKADHREAQTRLQELRDADPLLGARVRLLAPPATQQLIARTEQGDADARVKLALHLIEGDDWLLVDEPEAARLLTLAATQGNAEAQCRLGECYAQGLGLERDPGQALAWWRKSAAQDYAQARYFLARSLAERDDAESHRDEILREYRRAAAQNEKRAMSELAELYLSGQLVPADRREAATWLRRLADLGDAHAGATLGRLAAEDGDQAAAREWYRKAAQLGDADARDALNGLDEPPAATKPANIVATNPPAPVPPPAPPPQTSAPSVRPPSATPQEEIAAALASFEEDFFQASGLTPRRGAIRAFSRTVADAGRAANLPPATIAETVLHSIVPKMEANQAEAYDYVMAIESDAFDQGALQRALSPALQAIVRAKAQAATTEYNQRQQAFDSMRDTFARANAGEANAEFELGQFFGSNAHVRDEALAAEWFRKAAAHGRKDTGPQLEWVGKLAFNSGLEAYQTADYEAARRKWELAVGLGSTSAKTLLGLLYLRGHGLPAPDPATAAKWLQQAADAGAVDAPAILSELYQRGEGVACDPAAAFNYARLSADKDSMAGLAQLAHCHALGTGTPVNDAEAIAWYQKALQKGFAAAKDWIELLGKPGPELRAETALLFAASTQREGTGSHGESPRVWLDYAAFLGNADARRWLATLHPTPSRYPAAAAAAAGNSAYQKKDYATAVQAWRAAAAAGNPLATLNLGMAYSQGLGVTKDIAQGLAWYQKAGDLGIVSGLVSARALRAQMAFTAGLAAYEAGDFAEARRQWQLAADGGHASSTFNLGVLHEKGQGVAPNLDQAKAHYQRGAALGSTDAVGALAKLKARTERSEYAQAEPDLANRLNTRESEGAKSAPGADRLRKHSPWTTDDILAALKAGVDHGALAAAIKADNTKDLYDLDVLRIRLSDAGRAIGDYSPLSMTLAEHELPGGGPWTHELAQAAVEARRRVTGREPKLVDTPELRKKAAAGDPAALLTYLRMPEEAHTLGPIPDEWFPQDLATQILAQKYVRGYEYVADRLRNNVDPAKNDPARRATLLFEAADAGDPWAMHALSLLFTEAADPAVATNYLEAEYWAIEAAARAPEGAMDGAYTNPQRDLALLYSFEKPFGGPNGSLLSTPDEATLRWARELRRRGGPLAQAAELGLQAMERDPRQADTRQRLATLPPEAPLWTASELAKLDAAAQGGDVLAALKLGGAYATGRGVHQRDTRAIAYYRIAAAKGSIPAMRALADHYGKGFGVNRDSAQRIAWLEKAGAAGDASAWREAGDLQHYVYPNSDLQQDFARARADYEKATAAGDADGWVGLALLARYERGMPKDEAKAVEYLRKAAEGGSAAGQYEFAHTLAQRGDAEGARPWYEKALANPALSTTQRTLAQQELEQLKATSNRPGGK